MGNIKRNKQRDLRTLQILNIVPSRFVFADIENFKTTNKLLENKLK